MFTITGKVKTIGKVQEISEKFRKRELVLIDSSGPFEQPLMFEATQDRVSILDGLKPGDDVTVTFNIRGREWEDKRKGGIRYFVSLNAFRVDANPGSGGGQQAPLPSEADIPDDLSEDDLPF